MQDLLTSTGELKALGAKTNADADDSPGWSPVYSIPAVLLQIKMAMCAAFLRNLSWNTDLTSRPQLEHRAPSREARPDQLEDPVHHVRR